MIKPEQPRIEIDDLAAVIRESMAAHEHQDDHGFANGQLAVDGAAFRSSVPELKLQPDFQPRSNNRYHISDLLRYHDRAFVDHSYRGILKRPPDATEFARDLQRLRSGELNKIDLLATLRYSTEGKAKGVELEGLRMPALVRQLGHLPVLGYFFRLAIALVRLPNQIRDQREFGGYVLSQNQQIADFVNAVYAEFNERVSRLEQTMSKHYQAIESRVEEQISSEKGFFENQIKTIRVQARQVKALVDELETGRKSLQSDELYAALEDRFRGSREEIKERFRTYLPYVETLRDGLVIDLGSGRGEWLELLSEAGIRARGVEENRVSIAQCRERGLEVIDDDALAHLHGLPDGSVAAVTGFHIIEHMRNEALVSLIDEVMRVLRPRGLAIFETPNPENVLVGSNFFYLDPTHHHPLPRELMKFLFDRRGFDPVEVLNLHPWESGRVAGEGELAERFNGYFFGPMDYAIVGWKPEHASNNDRDGLDH